MISNIMRKIGLLNNIKLYIKNRIFKKDNYKTIAFITTLLIALLIGVLLITSSSKYSKYIYSEGEYSGVAPGYHSDIKVKVKTDNYRILRIDITEHHEMPVISEVVFKDIPYRVIRENSTDVESVSGATYTSRGLLKALDDALSKAHLPDWEDK